MINFGQKVRSENLKGKIWMTSDLHFGHKNILKFCPDTRKFIDIQDMEESLIKEWNNTVSPEDIVIDHGDFSFLGADKTKEILSKLNGHIIHIFGNHAKAIRNGLKVDGYDYFEFRYNGIKIVCNHYAQRVWNGSHFGAIHTFGHSHGSMEGIGRSMDVGYDAVGKIISLDEVVELLQNVPIHKEDHH
ncbi:phosphoesterase [Vibrio phage eugene 12A10]|uniref:phosphoesterase n=1 Tax=Vibrio phage eugene 12A10 TaxID=573172 RepID=UPI0003515A49|nr:phosphoesterase [Vibrio phage eugene 12A10]AGN51480.1 hypothetical protein VPLG_00041 [Vibrio phage eugene 12A10]